MSFENDTVNAAALIFGGIAKRKCTDRQITINESEFRPRFVAEGEVGSPAQHIIPFYRSSEMVETPVHVQDQFVKRLKLR